ncbi:MAG: hypothetical protein P1U61_03890 [Legionellaceae bacterium]|nr:hypothetical protein [Legionellaceae bacterium]
MIKDDALDAVDQMIIKSFRAMGIDNYGELASKAREALDAAKGEEAQKKALAAYPPLCALEIALHDAIDVFFDKSERKEQDINQLKKAFSDAETICVEAYRKQGKPTIAEYIRVSILALVGVIIAPLVPLAMLVKGVDPVKKAYLDLFFGGPCSPEARAAKNNIHVDLDVVLTAG